MNFRYLIILLLPIILHIKASPAIIVFLVMNSIISFLMEYTKIQIKIIGSLIDNEDILDKHMEAGSTQEAAFAEYMENVNEEETEEWIPKPINLTSNVSMTINLIAIVIGIIKIIR